jgi:diguanylate cyclase (GGDEF)-like protein
VTAPFPPESEAPRVRTHRTAAATGVGAPHDWISHSLRHLERWVGWSIAVYTAWLAAVAFPGVPALWALALYAGLIGKWAEAYPARHQAEMAWRGAALIAGAYIIHTHAGADVGGPGGPFFFWLSITCLYYAFMLKPAWAAGLVALAVAEFALAGWQAPSASAADLLAQGAFLCIFPLLLAMKFGIVMRRPDEALENGRIDSGTALYNKQGLLALGDEMLAAARREHRPLAVAVFDCADLLEVRTIYGSRIARKLLARIVRRLMSVTADRGLAARTGPAEFTVVLPGMTREKALAAIQKVLGNPSRIELDAGDSEIVLVPSFLIEVAGADTGCIDELYRDVRRELAQINQHEQRRQHHMRRERERHSRPMPLHSQPSPSEATRPASLHPDATLPAMLVA